MLDRRRGLLFPAPAGGHIDINNWRGRQRTPGVDAAGVQHQRIYDLRHTYATWSLAAGIDILTLARRMGTSVKMIDRTYGHLVAGADEYERELLDRFDSERSEPDGRYLGAEEEANETGSATRITGASSSKTSSPRRRPPGSAGTRARKPGPCTTCSVRSNSGAG
jgi:hypothetical protein